MVSRRVSKLVDAGDEMTASGGETREDPSGWTTDTLRMYIQTQLDQMATSVEQRYQAQEIATEKAFDAQQEAMKTALLAQKEAVNAALASAKEAVLKAEQASDKRFESVNEFRQQLNDQAQTFMPRNESEGHHTRHNERIHDIQVMLPRLLPRDEATALLDRNNARIQDLADRLNRMEGKDEGMSATMGYIIAIVGFVATLISIIAAVIAFNNQSRLTESAQVIMPLLFG